MNKPVKQSIFEMNKKRNRGEKILLRNGEEMARQPWNQVNHVLFPQKSILFLHFIDWMRKNHLTWQMKRFFFLDIIKK